MIEHLISTYLGSRFKRSVPTKTVIGKILGPLYCQGLCLVVATNMFLGQKKQQTTHSLFDALPVRVKHSACCPSKACKNTGQNCAYPA